MTETIKSGESLEAGRQTVLDDMFIKFVNEADYFSWKTLETRQSDRGQITAYDSLIKDGSIYGRNDKIVFSPRLYFQSNHWKFDAAHINELLPKLRGMYKKDGPHNASELLKDEAEATALDRELKILSWLGIIQNYKIPPFVATTRGLEQLNQNMIPGFSSPVRPSTSANKIKDKQFDISPDILRCNNSKELVEKYLKIHNSTSQASANSSAPLRLTKLAEQSHILPRNKEIFIVHGHDDEARKSVADAVKTFGLEPTILHEKANEGLTLVEKLEKHSDVGFAIVVMTSDDIGKAKAEKDLKPRARQNVILEWGYFIGKLGRKRVCALYDEGLESPSDLNGIVYIPRDKDGNWKRGLRKELKAAGYNVYRYDS